MIRILVALSILLAITAAGIFFVGFEPSYDSQLLSKIKLVSEIKKVRPLAAQGDKNAQYQLARLYEFGDPETRNPQLAALWYLRAAEQGHSRAQYDIGRMYDTGDGVKQDFYTAAKWYRLAATFGNIPEAQFSLAQLYFYGRGIDQDYGRAIEFYKRAAAQDHPVAQHLLGAMYENAWGVKQDYIRAYMWYKLASPHAQEVSKQYRSYNPMRSLQSLQTKMNRYQIEEAEKQLAALKAQ